MQLAQQQCRHSIATFAIAKGSSSGVDLTGQSFLVSGSTDGIGLHTAARLAAAGANVLVHGRNPGRVEAAVARVQEAARAAGGDSNASGLEARLRSYVADLSSLEEVRRLAADVRRDFPDGIHTLINNAGVYEDRLSRSKDGLEMTWAVNVLAPFLLTSLLIDKVQSQVITTSSISAASHLDMQNLQQERGYSAHGAYSLSKLCNQVFTLKLARVLQEAGSQVLANTLDPGTVNTKMLLAGWGRIGIEVRDADNTWALAANPGPRGETGAYYISASKSRPVSVATDRRVQDELWALWERQTGQEFRL